MNVLVVDDDREVRSIVCRALDFDGVRTSEAATGAVALAHVKDCPVDLVVLDLHLPDMTGLEVLADLRAVAPSIYVLMLTGAGSEADRVLGLVSGADDYMVKPFSARELAARVLAVSRRATSTEASTRAADDRDTRTSPGTRAALHPHAESGAMDTLDATVVIAGTTIRFASESMVELSGATSRDELIGHDVFEFVAPQSIGATRARQLKAQEGHWPRPEIITIVRPDGTEVLVEIASAPVMWEGEPASQVTLWDLAGDTSPLRELATGFSSDVPDAVIVTTEDLRIQSFNEAAEALYGWREADVAGRLLNEAIGWDGADGRKAAQQQLFDTGRWYGEDCQQRRDGSPLIVRSSQTVLRDGNGEVVGVVSVNRPVIRSSSAFRQDEDDRDHDIADAIRSGITRGEFVVHYQPVVHLESGEALGVEALVRWQHPQRGLLAPAEFIGIAERTGAIHQLGRVVLEQACLQAQAWRARGHDLHVAVNLSAQQLADDTLTDQIGEVMAATSTPTLRLWLEVTETSLVQDLDQAAAALRRIDDLGACVSIDDFGTGWASLTYLREFAVHALKVDRVFVADLGTGSRDETIVGSMVSLARELDVGIVAEGIETEAQRSVLMQLGCEYGQGYLFGRAQPATEIDRWLDAHGSRGLP